jgi:hypothetical protein
MLLVREGKGKDFRAYVNGGDFPKDWCADEPEGLAVFDDGRLIAIAMVTIDDLGRTWIWFHQKVRLSGMVLHRHAKELVDTLVKNGRKVHVFVDPNEPGAEKWVRRLGFKPAGTTTHPDGQEKTVWTRG